MKTAIVGYTGFVGSNISNSFSFDGLYNSKNIEEAFGTNPDLLIYCGIPAQKFIANSDGEADLKIINNVIENIKKINPKEIVLISTIDIYKNPVGVDEDTVVDTDDLEPYGKNRYFLEEWVRNHFEKYLVVRLPGLYGINLKKNFIYDFINIIPSMLKEEKFNELEQKDNYLNPFYELQDNGFYKLKALSDTERQKLKEYFLNIGFSALNFTDSRGIFQFYNLKYLWNHIKIARNANLKLLNLATEPVSISELYKSLTNKEFVNEISSNIPHYDYRTKNYELFGGKDGYIFDKDFVLSDIKEYVRKK
jgi:hypothetical protein